MYAWKWQTCWFTDRFFDADISWHYDKRKYKKMKYFIQYKQS